MKKPNTRRNLDVAIEKIVGDRDQAIQTKRYMANIIIPLEIGHNEIGDADEADIVEPVDLYDIFNELSLKKPGSIRLMKLEHQIA